jgi:hypothetical protein
MRTVQDQPQRDGWQAAQRHRLQLPGRMPGPGVGVEDQAAERAPGEGGAQRGGRGGCAGQGGAQPVRRGDRQVDGRRDLVFVGQQLQGVQAGRRGERQDQLLRVGAPPVLVCVCV